MTFTIDDAIKFAEGFRYSDDIKTHSYRPSLEPGARQADFALSLDGLEINEHLTPQLARGVKEVCDQLQLPDEFVKAYVYEAQEVQASCRSNGSGCIVTFSSALVRLLELDEFKFVVGHEIGHFLMGHTLGHSNVGSLEHFLESPAKEISADRMGMVGCGELDGALRALMKTASGLDSKHLRFDLVAYLKQSDTSAEGKVAGVGLRTHPPMLMRSRALLWFSMHDWRRNSSRDGRSKLAELDKRISNELNEFVQAPVREKVDEAKADYRLWLAVYLGVRDGVLDASEQAILREMFGADVLSKIASLLGGRSITEVRGLVFERMNQSRDALFELMPARGKQYVESILTEVHGKYGVVREDDLG